MAILEKRSDNVEIHGDVNESGFTILASAEAFEILSDRIYPNKIKAVVRELTTNAVDATIDAQKVSKLHLAFHNFNHREIENSSLEDAVKLASQFTNIVNDNINYVEREIKTFKANPKYNLAGLVQQQPLVHLPNRVEPFFSVRDYGTGLSHEFIMKLYTTYFWSDKKTSNDYTGCLGLGSKSPFAYTDSFTVTSYWNGEKRMYNAHLKGGFPAISVFVDDNGKEIVYPTDEPNGLEVSFNVRSTDYDEFANEAKRLYPYFKIQPKVVGNTLVKNYLDSIVKHRAAGTYYAVHDEDWGFRRPNNELGIIGPMAVMGNIAYPIKLQTVYNYDEITRKILNSNIDIVFPVGSLQITPSREQLSYKPSTIKAIEDRIAEIKVKLAGKLEQRIAAASSLWEARCTASELFHSGDFDGFGNLLSINKIQWNGQELGSTLHCVMPQEKGYTIYRFSINNKRKKQEVHNIPFNRNIKLYEMDLPRGSFSRLEMACGRTQKDIYAVEFADKAAKDFFLNHLGMDSTVILPGTSTLDKPERSERVTYSNDSQIFKFKEPEVSYGRRRHNYSPNQYSYWEETDTTFNLQDGGVYVELKRFKAVDISDTNKEIAPCELKELYDHIKKIDPSIVLIGVRSKMVKEFKESDDWVDIKTYCTNLLKNKVIKDNLDTTLADIKQRRYTNYFENLASLALNIDKAIINPNSAAKMLFKKLIEVNSSASKIKIQDEKSYIEIAERVGFKFDGKPTHNIVSDSNTMLDSYPMLRLGITNVSNDTLAVANYINMLDA